MRNSLAAHKKKKVIYRKVSLKNLKIKLNAAYNKITLCLLRLLHEGRGVKKKGFTHEQVKFLPIIIIFKTTSYIFVLFVYYFM